MRRRVNASRWRVNSFSVASRSRRAGASRCGAGTKSAPAGSQVVRIPGLQARPLGGGTSIGTHTLLAFPPLWPADGRVLPSLLPPVDGQVEQPVVVVHRLDAAHPRPVSLEDIGSLAQVANDVHHAHLASDREFRASPGRPSTKASPSP